MSNSDAAPALALGLLFLLGMAGKNSKDKKPEDKKPEDKKPEDKKPEDKKPEDKKPNTPAIEDITNDDSPVPGMFYQVRSGDFGLRVASKALKDAAYRAAIEYRDADHSEALAFASKVGGNAQNQFSYLDMITCEAWNDATVTTHGAGEQARFAPGSKRAIRFVPQHADNLARLASNMRAIRNVHMGYPTDKLNNVKRGGVKSAWRQGHEVLYLPGLDLQYLASTEKPRSGGGKWPDGSSKKNPPAWVMKLGIRDHSKTMPKGDKVRGCGAVSAKIGSVR